MTKIIKWLDDNGIEYELSNDGAIYIYIKRDCVWINGFGEPMKYSRKFTIAKDETYKRYFIVETTGYNMSHKHIYTSRQNEIIGKLDELKESRRI